MGIIEDTERRYKKYQERQNRILAAATKIFGQKTYNRATMSMIAKEAGVNEAIIYKHFSGKRELYLACWSAISERVMLLPPEDEVDEQPLSLESVAGALERFLQFLGETEDGAGFVLQLISAYNDPDIRDTAEEVIRTRLEAVASMVESGKKTGEVAEKIDTDLFSMAFLGFLLVASIEKSLGFGHEIEGGRARAFLHQMLQ